MNHFRLLPLIPIFLIMLAACRVSDSPTGIGDTKGNISTSIAGMVNDENGQPIEGAIITANGKTTTTSEYGTFMIQNATVPSDRCFILCKKNGYFTGSRAETPISGGITELRLTMQSNTASYSVDGTSGGKITVGGASVTFHPASLVTTNGTPYTGIAKVAVKFLDPVQNSFYNSFSGDMTGKHVDGSQTELLSYGVLRVQITDASGNELKLAAGKTATLTYPIASSMQKNAPASMPLWYFDETLGMWKEEGAAVKSGDVFTGEVSHFSDWNLDSPTQETGTIKGRVVCENEGVEGILVTIGQKKVITDKNGYFSRKAPLNLVFTISVNSSENNGLVASDIAVPALTNGETRTVNVPLSICPAYIKGTIVDCNNKPTAGTIILTFSGGQYIVHFTSDGNFKLRAPTDVPLSITATTLDGKLTGTKQIEKLSLNDSKEIGQFSACGNGSSVVEFYDINVDDMNGNSRIASSLLSPDGSIIAISGYRESNNCFTEIYDTKTGKKLYGFSQNIGSNAKKFSLDGTKLLINFTETISGEDSSSSIVINTQTGVLTRNFNYTGNGDISSDGNEFITAQYDTSLKMFRCTITSISDGSVRTVELSDKYIVGTPYLLGIREQSQLVMYYKSTSIADPKRNIPGSYQQIYYWDVRNNLLTYGYGLNALGNPSLLFYSPDFFISYVDPYTNGQQSYFYNTLTNSKIATISSDYSNTEQTFAIANDMTYVYNDLSYNGNKIPTIYDIRSQKILKILPVKSQSITYGFFNFSANSQYLAGIEDSGFQPSNSVRVWKLK